MRLPDRLSAFMMRRRRRTTTGGAVEVRRGRELGLGYDDAGVLELADRDGRAGFNTLRWGPRNRETHGLLAVLASAGTHAAAIRVKLDEELAATAAEYAEAVERFRGRRIVAYQAQTRVARQVAHRVALARKLADNGLDEPTARWPVILVLALLAAGDLAMTSTAMLVLNVPDQRFVSWLPFSELHLTAVPTVVGMFGAAHWLGESLKAHRCEPQLRSTLRIVAATSVIGSLGLAVSVAALRTSYLNSIGVPALSGAFVGIQLGLLAVAVAASTWAAHPYGAAWRQVERRERQAHRRYIPAREEAGREAAVVNELVRKHQGQVVAAQASVEAVLSDSIRQAHLYVRELQHGQPEPTEEELFAGELPEPIRSKSVQELLDYPEVTAGSSLAALEFVDLKDLDEAWETLYQRESDAPGTDESDDSDETAPTAEPTPTPPGAA